MQEEGQSWRDQGERSENSKRANREMNDEWEGSRSEEKRDQGLGRAELIKDGGDESVSDHGGGGRTRLIREGGE